jgi:hypothetical protein
MPQHRFASAGWVGVECPHQDYHGMKPRSTAQRHPADVIAEVEEDLIENIISGDDQVPTSGCQGEGEVLPMS